MSAVTIPVTIESKPRRHLAYTRHIGPFIGNTALFERLFTKVMNWASPLGYLSNSKVEAITIYHNDPDKVPAEKHRIDVGFTVPAGTQAVGDINVVELPAGKYAIGSFEIFPNEYGKAWDEVFQYIHDKQLKVADGPMYESYKNDPESHPEGKHKVDICIHLKNSIS